MLVDLVDAFGNAQCTMHIILDKLSTSEKNKVYGKYGSNFKEVAIMSDHSIDTKINF